MRVTISCDEDPGQPGSVAADGTTERSVNIRVALALQAVLERCGVQQSFDPNIGVVQRVAQANRDGTDLLVACAHNSSTDGASGTQFVFSPGGEQFGRQAVAADAVYGELRLLPGWPARRGNIEENVYECWAFNRDTVYAELLFMSPQDRALWSRPDYAPMVAEAMVRGLAKVYGFAYLPPGADSVTPAPAPAVVSIHGGRPVLTVVFNGQLHLFYVTAGGDLLYRWAGGHQLGDQPKILAQGMQPGALLDGAVWSNQLHVFGPRADGRVQYVWAPTGVPGEWGSEVLA